MQRSEESRSRTPASRLASSDVVSTTTPPGSESDSAPKGERTSAASSPSEVWRTRMSRRYRRPPNRPLATGGRIERWITGQGRGRRAAP